MNSVERSNRFLLGARAQIVESDKEIAWAEKYVRQDPQIKWILGNFVEADRANDNGHIFPLEDLRVAQASIPHKSLNMLHHGNYIVGSFAAAEMMWPEGVEGDGVGPDKFKHQAASDAGQHPYIEALGAFWRNLFPEEYQLVEKAHKEGALYYSMETIPETLNCVVDGCQFKETAVAYDGRQSKTYCDHMNAPRGSKILNKPHFGGGALIIPRVRPGWSRADISELSNVLNDHADEAEAGYATLETDLPHLDPKDWESMMGQIMLQARQDKYGAEGRRKLAKEGKALPGGEFPIADEEDLRNAVQNIGRAKNPTAARQHIMKRARALGLSKHIPDHWNS